MGTCFIQSGVGAVAGAISTRNNSNVLWSPPGMGELRIRRTLAPRLLDELGAWPREEIQPKRAVAGRLVELMQREREIAALVGTATAISRSRGSWTLPSAP
jgi:hypothetical protein